MSWRADYLDFDAYLADHYQYNTGLKDIQTGWPIYQYILKSKVDSMKAGQLCYLNTKTNQGYFSCVLVMAAGRGKWLVEVIKNRGNRINSFGRRHDVPVGYSSVGQDKYAYISVDALQMSHNPFYFIMTFSHHALSAKREVLRQLEGLGYQFPPSKALCQSLYGDFSLSKVVGVYADGFNLRPIMDHEGALKKPAKYSWLETGVSPHFGVPKKLPIQQRLDSLGNINVNPLGKDTILAGEWLAGSKLIIDEELVFHKELELPDIIDNSNEIMDEFFPMEGCSLFQYEEDPDDEFISSFVIGRITKK